MIPSKVLLIIASSDDSTMAARWATACSEVSLRGAPVDMKEKDSNYIEASPTGNGSTGRLTSV
jgi:hypothetical protein